jgi:hypothetical protein
VRARSNTASIAFVATLAALSLLAGCSPLATKGTVPPPGPNGIDPSSAPDFLAVAGRDRDIAGYARKEDVLGGADAPFPVYGDDLRTVVGQMVPGKGFVPVGVDPDTVPRFPVVAEASGLDPPSGPKVVLYVRNDSLTQIHDAVFVEGQIQDSGGFWGQNMGAACYSMPVGSRLVLLDRSATQPGASVVRELYARGNEQGLASLWITIAKDGSIQQGAGVPGWWGAPLNC